MAKLFSRQSINPDQCFFPLYRAANNHGSTPPGTKSGLKQHSTGCVYLEWVVLLFYKTIFYKF